MRKRKIPTGFLIVLIIFAILMVGCLISYIHWNSPKAKEWLEHTSQDMTWTLTSIDSMLFRVGKYKGKLASIYREKSDVRNDKNRLDVYNDGDINYTSIDLKEDRPLDEVLFFQKKDTPLIKEVHAMTSIHTRLRQGPPTDTIICSYTADPDVVREFRHGDNLRVYNLMMKTFSIRYGENEPLDMSIARDWEKTPLPRSFAFLKKGKKVYFFVYGRNLEKTYPTPFLEDDFLGRVINWEEN